MSTDSPSDARARVADLTLRVDLPAAVETAWRALTADIDRWWPEPFYCSSGGGEPRMVLEAWPGGRMWEDRGGGEGLVWASVVQVVAQRRLDLCGTTGPGWGGPNTWLGSIELTAAGDRTALRFTEAAFGRLSASYTAEKEKGWRYLFDGALRAWLEGRPAPAWRD